MPQNTGYIIMRLVNNDVYGVARATDMDCLLPDLVCRPVMGSVPVGSGRNGLGQSVSDHPYYRNQLRHRPESGKNALSQERIPA
jgi:hypothetical protein